VSETPSQEGRLFAMRKVTATHNPAQTTLSYTENAPPGLLAQMRTIGPAATNTKRRTQYRSGQDSSKNKAAVGNHPSDGHALIASSTNSSSGWHQPDDDYEPGDADQPSASRTGDFASSRLKAWRDKWPVIEMFTAFEQEHYQNAWFGPLMIFIVVLSFAATTVVGLLLLVITT
jgi:hypothetical protein